MLEFIRNMDQSTMECSVILCSHGPLEAELMKLVPVEVVLLGRDILDTRKDTLTGFNFTSIRRILGSVPFILQLSKAIKQHRPDVVHTNSLKADILGGIAARIAGVPLLWHIRDRIAADYLPAMTVKLIKLGCRILPDQVVGCSQAVLDTLDLPASKPGFVVYSGINLDKFPQVDPHRGGLTVGIRKIGLVGRLAPWKGQHIFISAAERLHQRYPDLEFLLIGSAMFGEHDYEQQLREQVKSAGLEDVVEFRGFIREVEKEIMNLDVLVHASTSAEPFGQTIVQGMAAGKPVIAARGGGASEVVRDGVDGILIDGGDPRLLEEALISLIERPLFAEELARQGRLRVQQKFTIQQTVAALTEALTQACKHK